MMGLLGTENQSGAGPFFTWINCRDFTRYPMLEPRDYLGKIQSLKKQYTGRMTASGSDRETDNQDELNNIEFASANLRHLLLDIPIENHAEIINEILFTQACATLDGDSCFLLETTKIIDPESMLLAAGQKPVIFCTFHFGSYQLINQVLASRGLNYVLPVSNDNFANYKRYYEDKIEVIRNYFRSASQLLVLNAEEPTAALAMARKTRAGWSLLAYIDGNTGVQGAARRDAKMLRVSLLGKPIYARKGIAFLSHFLKLPIIPVICEITGPMERTMTFYEKIKPFTASEDRETYCQMATEKLYSILGTCLKKSPSQWLGWLELQKYLATNGLATNESNNKQDANSVSLADKNTDLKLMFNNRRFGFIVQDDQRVLLDKTTYKLLSLPDNISDLLESYRQPIEVSSVGVSDEQMDMIEQLVSMDILSVVS